MRRGLEEGRAGIEEAERVRGENRGEQEKRNHYRHSNYRIKEKTGIREMCRDLKV